MTAGADTGVEVAGDAAPAKRRVRPRISLMQLLSGAFGALMVLGLLAVLALSGLANYRNTFSLLNANAVLTMQALKDDLVASLEPSARVVEAVTRFYGEGRFGLDPTPARTTIFEGILAGAPNTDAIVLYPREGHATGVARDGEFGVMELDRPGRLPGEVRALLRNIAPGAEPAWGPPVFVDGATYVNVVAPLERDGSVDGAVVLAIGADHLSRIVTRVVSGGNGVAFILYDDAGVLAVSGTGELHADDDPRRPGKAFVPLEQVADPVLVAYADRKPLAGFGAAETAGVEVSEIAVNGRRFTIVTEEVAGFGPRPWRVGVYLPLSDFTDVVRWLSGSIAAGLLILALSLAAVVYIGRRISRVLGRTAAAAHRIAELRLSEVEPLPPSFVREIDVEAKAFNRMQEGLASFARYVPRQFVEKLIREGDQVAGRSRTRKATVMFTDIVGFTSLSERMPAEAVAALLNDHFADVVAAVGADGGLVDKYLGDGVMAFWMGPGEEARPAAAVAAARAICARVGAAAARARAAGLEPIRVRIGLHTGEVIAGNVGPPDRVNYTVVGDTVNVASRLESLGREVAPDADCVILASDTTVSALAADVPRRRIGDVRLRNRSHPLDVWQIAPEGCGAAVPAPPAGDVSLTL